MNITLYLFVPRLFWDYVTYPAENNLNNISYYYKDLNLILETLFQMNFQ